MTGTRCVVVGMLVSWGSAAFAQSAGRRTVSIDRPVVSVTLLGRHSMPDLAEQDRLSDEARHAIADELAREGFRVVDDGALADLRVVSIIDGYRNTPARKVANVLGGCVTVIAVVALVAAVGAMCPGGGGGFGGAGGGGFWLPFHVPKTSVTISLRDTLTGEVLWTRTATCRLRHGAQQAAKLVRYPPGVGD